MKDWDSVQDFKLTDLEKNQLVLQSKMVVVKTKDNILRYEKNCGRKESCESVINRPHETAEMLDRYVDGLMLL